MIELEKKIKSLIKEKSKGLFIENHSIKISGKGGKFINGEKEVGFFDFIYSKGKFIDYGAILGVKVNIFVNNSPIDSIIEELNLSFPKSPFSKFHNLSINSFDFQKNNFFKDGKLVFFPNDDLEPKINELMIKIQELYFSKINNYLNHLPSLKDDVLNFSKNYAYPLTTILINEHLNNNDLSTIKDLVKEAKSKKLYDANDRMLTEIKEKLDKAFNN